MTPKPIVRPSVDKLISIYYILLMAHTVTITVDDMVYEKLKPLIDQQTIGAFLSDVMDKKYQHTPISHPGITAMKGSLHLVDTSDVREEDDRYT